MQLHREGFSPAACTADLFLGNNLEGKALKNTIESVIMIIPVRAEKGPRVVITPSLVYFFNASDLFLGSIKPQNKLSINLKVLISI